MVLLTGIVYSIQIVRTGAANGCRVNEKFVFSAAF